LTINSVQPSTRAQYEAQFNTACHYLRAIFNVTLFDQVVDRVSVVQLDRAMSHIVQAHFDWDDSPGLRGYCQRIVSGLEYFVPTIAHHAEGLKLAKRALATWELAQPPAFTIPIDATMAAMLSITMLDDPNGYELALITMLSHDCYLRISSETLELNVQDVVLYEPANVFTDQSGARVYGRLQLARTKTGFDQSVTIRQQALADELRVHIGSRQTGPLFCTTYYHYLRAFGMAAARLGILLRLRPHGFRAGGATSDKVRGASDVYIQERGR
jgi:integrase